MSLRCPPVLGFSGVNFFPHVSHLVAFRNSGVFFAVSYFASYPRACRRGRKSGFLAWVAHGIGLSQSRSPHRRVARGISAPAESTR